ncbi:MAG: 2-oxoacid:acceptor oxidoreductase family protein [Nitrososphaerota archaeon]
MIEIRWHGRGGQGAVTASVLLAQAVIIEGSYAQAFAEFGPERRGAPVAAYTRIDDKPIYTRCSVYNPDIVVVLDPVLLTSLNVTEGLKDQGKVIVNTIKSPYEVKELLRADGLIATVNATKIALETLRLPIVNTAMLGSVVRAMGSVQLDSIIKVVEKRFSGKAAEANVNAVIRAYKETQILEGGRCHG